VNACAKESKVCANKNNKRVHEMRIYRNKVYANKSNKVCKKYYDFGRNIFFYQKMGPQPFHRTFWPDKWDSVRGIVGLILMRVSIIFLWVRVSFISTIYSIDR